MPVGISQTVLVAPASFKGAMSAVEVADAIAQGLEHAGVPADRCPVADGGEGTLAALSAAFDCSPRELRVRGPRGRTVPATFAMGTPGRQGSMAVIEAVAATPYGTGELVGAAAREGAALIYLGVGESAATDGGAEAIQAIEAAGGLGGAKLVVLCAPSEVRIAGAPSGLPGALRATLGAQLVPGAAFVLDAVRFDQRMRDSRAVITGEGRLDEHSLAGTLVSEIATRARQAGVPCHAVVGRRELDPFGARVLDIGTIHEAGTPAELEAAGRALAPVVGLAS